MYVLGEKHQGLSDPAVWEAVNLCDSAEGLTSKQRLTGQWGPVWEGKQGVGECS